MSNYYTHVTVYADGVLFRGIENGVRIQRRIEYKPNLYVPTKNESLYKSMYGENLQKISPGTITETKAFIKQYENVSNFNIYGNLKHNYQYIAENYSDIEFDINDIRIFALDIETLADDGFVTPQDATKEITAITVKVFKGKSYTFGNDVNRMFENNEYFYCEDEITILKRFIQFWSSDYPDIVTGWNIIGYDITYLGNRILKILGEKYLQMMSPWNVYIADKRYIFKGETYISYSFIGVAIIDYMFIYRMYHNGGERQPSYKLDNITKAELGHGKLDWEEMGYSSLHDFYLKDYTTYIEYNIIDTVLVEQLDDKCKLLEMTLNLAYQSHGNYEDVMNQTRMGDSLFCYVLYNKNIFPPQSKNGEIVQFGGGYVKQPKGGLYNWIVSLDATSLYPSEILTNNISIETLVQPQDYNDDMLNILSKNVTVDKLLSKEIDLSKLKDNNITLTPNGQFFRTDEKGFIPEIVESIFAKRKAAKQLKIKYEKLNIETPCAEYENLKQKYDNLQNALKLLMNGAIYGSLGTRTFRFFDVRLAEAITTSGQYDIRSIQEKVNIYINKQLKGNNKDYVIFSDTDSVGLSLEDYVNLKFKNGGTIKEIAEDISKLIETKLQPFLNGVGKENAEYKNSFSQSIFFKVEKICPRGIFSGQKKRYCLYVYSNEGVIYNEDKRIKDTGLVTVSSTTPKIVKDYLKNCLRIMLTKDEVTLQSYVKEVEELYFNLSVEEIASIKSVSGIAEHMDKRLIYVKGTPIQCRAAILYNHLLDKLKLVGKYDKIRDKDKIKFIYLVDNNPSKENVLGFIKNLPKEFKLEKYIDYNLMYDKTFISPLKQLTDACGWSLGKENNLMDLF